ncbi:30S ribosomal protein 3-1, chloroplastic [Sesamum alatum]|uniref:30S ribosomal protein 3, chloroplastic n=1 Tax=Sesamum alatum TaxID=300844 RepID=A0AAE1YHJ2_9LAMI|nr:30S ribosomal protein 3-1, chloroplastic [Sesamum alatum]
MLSLSVQASMKGSTLTDRPSAVFKNLSSAPFKDSFSVKPRDSSLHSLPTILHLNSKPLRRIQRLPTPKAAAATELAPEETPAQISDSQLAQEPEVVGVAVKSVVKPRLVLKFIWMEKNIGLGLDQIIPGHGTVPLSPYFFWPRKDAWEELKATLESKPWISQKKMIILLNQATDIINLWQQSGGNLS